MKNLKELLIGDDDIWDIIGEEYQSILKREIPHLRIHDGWNMFEVAQNSLTNMKDFRFVTFCPNCHIYDDYYESMYRHKCLKK